MSYFLFLWWKVSGALKTLLAGDRPVGTSCIIGSRWDLGLGTEIARERVVQTSTAWRQAQACWDQGAPDVTMVACEVQRGILGTINLYGKLIQESLARKPFG